MGVHTFRNVISLKVNVIAQLKFELAYFLTTVKDVSHYAMDTFFVSLFLKIFL